MTSTLFVGIAHAAITLNPNVPTIAAKSYILQDFASGRIIAQHNSDQPLSSCVYY